MRGRGLLFLCFAVYMKLLNRTAFKRTLLSFMLCVLVLAMGATTAAPVFADDEKDSYTVDQGIMDAFTTEPMGMFKDNPNGNYYYLDMVSERDANKVKSDSTWEDIKDSLFGWADVKGNFMDNYNLTLNSVANLYFRFNVFMTSSMITVLDFAFSVDVISDLIDSLEKSVADMTGISSGKFTGGGLFGGMLYIIAVLAVIYMLYAFIVKRAFIESFGTLVKTIVALCAALLLLSNYSTFVKTTQSLSNSMTAYVMGMSNWGSSSSNGYLKEAPKLTDAKVNTDVRDSLWAMFVDRPYLYMQYGTHDLDEIQGGKQRVMNILGKKPGEERNEAVLNTEIKKYNNDLMVSSSVLDRLAFAPFYLLINGVVSLPIFGLALMLIVLQFWFIVIAAIAPFALLIGAIPGFFGVLKRYSIELVIPLALKVFFAFFTIVLLVMSQALYAIDIAKRIGGNTVIDYLFVAVFQFVLFLTIFLLRKRIMGIFSSGSQVIAGLREASGPLNPITHVKKGVQTTATIAGTAVGAYVGGAAGAAIGANIGSSMGRAVTGEAGVQEVASATASAARYKQLSKLGEGFNSKKGANVPDGVNPMETDMTNPANMIQNQPNHEEIPLPDYDEIDAEYKDIAEMSQAWNDPSHQEAAYSQLNDGYLHDESSSNPNNLHSLGEMNWEGIGYESSISHAENNQDAVPPPSDNNPIPVGVLNNSGDLEGYADNSVPIASKQNHEAAPMSSNEFASSELSSTSVNPTGLSSADMDNKDIIGVALSGNQVESSPLQSSGFKGSEMDTSSLGSSQLESKEMPNADMSGSAITGNAISGSEMAQSSLNSSDLKNSEMASSSLNGSDMGSSSFQSSEMKSSNMGGSELKGSNMNSSSLVGSDLGGNPLGDNPLESSTLISSPLGSRKPEGKEIKGNPLTDSELENVGLNVKSKQKKSTELPKMEQSTITVKNNAPGGSFPELTPINNVASPNKTTNQSEQE